MEWYFRKEFCTDCKQWEILLYGKCHSKSRWHGLNGWENSCGMVWMAERITVAWFEWLREFLWHGLNNWENSCGIVWMTERIPMAWFEWQKIPVAWFEWVRNTLWHGICHNEFPWHCLYDRKQQRLVLLRIFPWHEFFLALMMVLIRKKELFCIQIYKQIKYFYKL